MTRIIMTALILISVNHEDQFNLCSIYEHQADKRPNSQ